METPVPGRAKRRMKIGKHRHNGENRHLETTITRTTRKTGMIYFHSHGIAAHMGNGSSNVSGMNTLASPLITRSPF